MKKYALLCFCLLALPAAAAPADKRIYKIDSVITSVRGGVLTVQVKGAVQSGGWKAPRLRAVRGAAHTLVFDVVAQPPAANVPVIEGLVPIAAHAAMHLRPGIIAVEAQGDANTITTQLLH